MKSKRKAVSPIFLKGKDFKLNTRSQRILQCVINKYSSRSNFLDKESLDEIELMYFPVIAKYIDENLSFHLVKLFKEQGLTIEWDDLISPLDNPLNTITSNYLKTNKHKSQIEKQIGAKEAMLIAQKIDTPMTSTEYKRVSIKDPSIEMLNLKHSRKYPIDIKLIEKHIPPKFKVNDIVVSTSKQKVKSKKANMSFLSVDPFFVDSCFFVDSINSLFDLINVFLMEDNTIFFKIQEVLMKPAQYIGTWFYKTHQISGDIDKSQSAIFHESNLKLDLLGYDYKEKNGESKKYLQYFYYIADEIIYPYKQGKKHQQTRGILMSLSEYPLTGIPAFLPEDSSDGDTETQSQKSKRNIPILIKNDPDDDGVIPEFINAVTLRGYNLEPESIVFVDTRCLSMEISRMAISDFMQDRADLFREISEFMGGIVCKT